MTAAKVATPPTATPAPTISFRERAAIHNATAWLPKANDELHGELVGVRVGSTTEYQDYPVLVFKTPDLNDGYTAFHCFHGVARERLSEIKPKKGDVLHILYGGTKVGNKAIVRNGKEEENVYHLYYIERDGDTTSGLSEGFDFSS